MKRMALLLIVMIAMVLLVWWRLPLIGNEWSKQTIYVGLLDAWHGSSTDDIAYAMWIDDDSTEGVFKVKAIADEVGIKPAFAVIADRMEPVVADSLVSWQQQGAGIVLHGLRHERWKEWNEQQIEDDIQQSYQRLYDQGRHERWKEWNEQQIEDDIQQSYQRLYDQGFDTTRIMKMIIPPHGCNTRIIRKVIAQHGCQMISGASLVNPDRHVFQLGRIGIQTDTNIDDMREILKKAFDRKAFIIFGTHSSIPAIFSAEKTREILKMAKEMGFCFDSYE